MHLARRKLPDGAWDTLVFDDYGQTTDDDQNAVRVGNTCVRAEIHMSGNEAKCPAKFGICPGDGTVHLSYDHQCDRYADALKMEL